jgi:hypothetical protein
MTRTLLTSEVTDTTGTSLLYIDCVGNNTRLGGS